MDTNDTSPRGDKYGLLFEFCGRVPFWNQSEVDQDLPRFSPCFAETMVWIPCAFIWIASPCFIYFMYRCRPRPSLPFSVLHISKVIVTMVLAFLTVLRLLFQNQYGYNCDGDQNISPIAYTSAFVKFLTFALSLVLLQIQRRRGLKTSAIPFLFWLMMIGSEIISLYTRVSAERHCKEDGVIYLFFGLLCVQFILHCIAEGSRPTGYMEIDKEKECPEEDSSVLNRLLFWWLTPIVWDNYRKKFSMADFWGQTPKLKSEILAPLLERAWQEEVTRVDAIRKQGGSKAPIAYTIIRNGHQKPQRQKFLTEETTLIENGHNSGKQYSATSNEEELRGRSWHRPNLYRVLLKVFWRQWMEATLYMGVGHIFWLVQPIALRFLIQVIDEKEAGTREKPMWQGIMYAVLLFLVLVLNSFFYHICFHHMMTLGLKVKCSLICIIYKKALTMKRNSNKKTTVGEIVNLMSVDCQRIQDAFLFSFYIVIIFPILIFAAAQLWDVFGVASLGCVAVVLFIFPTVTYIATLLYKLQRRLLNLKGTRIKILNEILSGIKVLKMYAWEPSFIQKVKVIRDQEIDCLRKYAVLIAITVFFSAHSPFMMNFVLFLIYVLTSPTHFLSAEQAFTAVSIVNLLRYPVALIPFLVNGGIQAYVSVGRIQEFLWTEDIDTSNVTRVTASEYSVEVRNGDFAWDPQIPPTLRNINLQVPDGQLIAVVGQVGSGKSSLISAILGEIEKRGGEVNIKGSVAYVPQEAWIQNMTLRDNILFGKSYNERRYNRVLDSCALLPDLQILAGGDMTEIGEKGINISGGQKQRVSLARAVYSNADIYLLDDPLSAVDSHVGKHLFKKVIGNSGLLRKKTRILVTHGVHWLPMVDKIIVLNDGVISESGTYEELISHNGAFAEFLHTYLIQEEEEEDSEIQKIRDQMLETVEYLTSDGGMTSDDNASFAVRRGKRVSPKRTTSAESSASRLSQMCTAPDGQSRLTREETSAEGSIKPTVLLSFIKAMGQRAFLMVFIIMALYQGLNIYSNFWLTYWTEDPQLKNISLSGTEQYQDTYTYYLVVYLILGVVQGILVYVSFYLALTRMVVASGRLHSRMLSSILKSPMSFFDTTPIGRMVNRFSSDTDILDNKLPESFRLWTIMVFAGLSVLIVVTINTPVFLVALVPVGTACFLMTKFYLPTARQLRRVESVCRSPIYNHFSETITGAGVIRAYHCAERFINESRKRVDQNIKFYFASNTGTRWIGIRLELIGNLVVLLVTIFALNSDELDGADVGLSISYAVQITVTLNLVLVAVTDMEMNIISAERVNEYTTLPSEAPWNVTTCSPDSNWPRKGTVEFRNFTVRYRQGLELVLKGINCRIKDGEMIGIVGRTGAGKSSLTLSLFRLLEAAGGYITIDGVNIADLGLHDLRTKLTIFPQDPVIFSGSLRSNLDPFGRFDDKSIWEALTCAHLKEHVDGMDSGLEYECGEGGQNLSVGQRQLVCLARTLLHKTKILILDEATAAVDMETDDLIQNTIRQQFKDCTIITIAHRLNTIMDYDRVMVLDRGLIKEFDAPATLLENTEGVFYGMAKDAGLV